MFHGTKHRVMCPQPFNHDTISLFGYGLWKLISLSFSLTLALNHSEGCSNATRSCSPSCCALKSWEAREKYPMLNGTFSCVDPVQWTENIPTNQMHPGFPTGYYRMEFEFLCAPFYGLQGATGFFLYWKRFAFEFIYQALAHCLRHDGHVWKGFQEF